jgi:hypothetical protein
MPKSKEKSKLVKPNTNILTQLAGEYHVCSELCRQGILALPAPKNNPLVDVVTMKPDATKTLSIQVKTIRNGVGWILGKLSKPNPMPPKFYMVLVQLKPDGTIDSYIYRYSDFLQRVTEQCDLYYAKNKKDGSPRKKVSFDWLDLKDFTRNDYKRLHKWELLRF